LKHPSVSNPEDAFALLAFDFVKPDIARVRVMSGSVPVNAGAKSDQQYCEME